MPYALCPMPYALCRMPYTLWITFLLNFFSVSELRNYLRKIPYEIRPMPCALCPIPIENNSPIFFAISKLQNYLGENFPVFFCYFEISKLRNYQIIWGKLLPFFFLLFRNYKII